MKRHELDVFSLLTGLLLVAAAAVWGVSPPGHVHLGRLGGASTGLLLILLGAVGLLASTAGRHRTRHDGSDADEEDPP